MFAYKKKEKSKVMSAFEQSETVSQQGDVAYVDSRFGKIKVDLNKTIFFPEGLLGMPDKTHFCLADFPDPNYAQFKILQSVDAADLAFITLPLDEDASLPSFRFIEMKDLDACMNALEIDRANFAVLLITSVHHALKDGGEMKISVNVRAPLILDTSKSEGIQYIFQSNKYEVRHVIS